jgi:hypothetical protein
MGDFADDSIERGLDDMFNALDHPDEGLEDGTEDPVEGAIVAFNHFSRLTGARSVSCMELVAPSETDMEIVSLALQAALLRSRNR